ncbi:hypothetical protein K505DRAFT_330400 [Melanomma pulvis-pyrius CBS 109.77]|uniref:Uncharacterized protein n=1 Tax=Melanomma pulvis-pyrius CBS 109.77 TaxID=1314802 RepID=A0A6A6WQL7_9PLEO|nr:hypothetical protein K505DRAFT_330400 [Melanomma pulvis-pyrius CBS 109.77]
MADDKAYEDFLNRANDTGGGVEAKESKGYKTKSVNAKVPAALEGVEEYYTSDADEPFEVVSLGFEGSDVSAEDLKRLIGHDAEVASIGEGKFDPQGQYKKVVDAVKKAGDGKVKVFRVGLGATRAEYYVVSVDEKEGRVVGLKALSVES